MVPHHSDIVRELSGLSLGALRVASPGPQFGNALVERLTLVLDCVDGVGGPAVASASVALVVHDEVEGASGAAHEVVEVGGPEEAGFLFAIDAVVAVVDLGDRW